MQILQKLRGSTTNPVDVNRQFFLWLVQIANKLRWFGTQHEGLVGLSVEPRKQRIPILELANLILIGGLRAVAVVANCGQISKVVAATKAQGNPVVNFVVNELVATSDAEALL